MPIFKCTKCGCVENTAVCNYWNRKQGSEPLCSACDPEIGQWHNKFPQISANHSGYVEKSDGFLEDQKELRGSD